MRAEQVPETKLSDAISLTRKFLQLRNREQKIFPKQATDELVTQIFDTKLAEIQERRMISNTLRRLAERIKNL